MQMIFEKSFTIELSTTLDIANGLIWKTNNLVTLAYQVTLIVRTKSCLNEKSNYFVGEMSGANLKWSLNDGG